MPPRGAETTIRALCIAQSARIICKWQVKGFPVTCLLRYIFFFFIPSGLEKRWI